MNPELNESLSFDQNIIQLVNSVDTGGEIEYVYLVRFFNDSATANSKYRQARRGTGSEESDTPGRSELLKLVREHMFEGNTEDSSFVSFTEDIAEFLRAINQQEKSKVVAQIVKGTDSTALYKKFKGKGAFRSPAKYIGVWRINSKRVVSWKDIDESSSASGGRKPLGRIMGSGSMMVSRGMEKRGTGFGKPFGGGMMGKKSSFRNVDLKKNYKEEREAVVYSPGELIDPVAIFGNPYYSNFLKKANEE